MVQGTDTHKVRMDLAKEASIIRHFRWPSSYRLQTLAVPPFGHPPDARVDLLKTCSVHLHRWYAVGSVSDCASAILESPLEGIPQSLLACIL